MVYADFSRAFDRIDHGVLCSKLERFNFSKDFINFIRSYLSNRQYFVTYNGFTSSTYVGTSGVPQGSNLGPLLFLLFIDDLPGILECSSLLYADDLKLFTDVSSVGDALFLQRQLDRLSEWCERDKLYLNVSKCKVISFTGRKSHCITFTCLVRLCWRGLLCSGI